MLWNILFRNSILFICDFRTPEQVPSVVSLLSESYNPHVRCGAAMALGTACAGTGSKVRFYPSTFSKWVGVCGYGWEQ